MEDESQSELDTLDQALFDKSKEIVEENGWEATGLFKDYGNKMAIVGTEGVPTPRAIVVLNEVTDSLVFMYRTGSGKDSTYTEVHMAHGKVVKRSTSFWSTVRPGGEDPMDHQYQPPITTPPTRDELNTYLEALDKDVLPNPTTSSKSQ